MIAEEKRMALPDRGRCWFGGSQVRIIAAASSPCGHRERLTRTKPQIHHKSVGLTGGHSTLFMVMGKQTEICGELSGVE
jgi:hypothetical protein